MILLEKVEISDNQLLTHRQEGGLQVSTSQVRYLTVIGDVHGCKKTLKALIAKIPQQDNGIILIGDLINKGPRSYQVHRYVKKHGYLSLLGNHEFYCLHRHLPLYQDAWLQKGGRQTIQSVCKKLHLPTEVQAEPVLDEMNQHFEQFYPYLLIERAYGPHLLLTHAGISARVYREADGQLERCLRMDLHHPESYLFNRGTLAQIPNCVQVIGHHPTAYAPRPVHQNYLIDSGCVYQRKGMGYLSALMFDLKTDKAPVALRMPYID